MRSMRQRVAAVTLLSGLTTLGIGLAAGPANASVETNCLGIIGQAQSGSLHLTGNPAAGSDAPLGSSITLVGSWDKTDYEETDRFYVCATVDGNYHDALSSIEQPLDNEGSFTSAAAVPSSLPIGSNLCFVGDVRGKLAASGVTAVDMVSETLCYRVAAATTPTTMATTTTTLAPIVEPAVIEAGSPAAPAVEAAPAPVEAPAPLPELPRTGSGIELLAGLGGLSVAAGGAARYVGRRRPAKG